MTDLLVLAGLLLGYGLVSRLLDRTWISAAMVFVAAGLLLGDAGLGILSGTADEGAIRVLAEATLVLVLFTDAVRIDLPALRREYRFPLRLLGTGMPLAIVLGAAAAWLILPGFGVLEAALLAAVLVPTDAALGATVVSDRRLPIRVRQTLNVESGLNDGIALPVVLVLVALAAPEGGTDNSAAEWVRFAAQQIGLGVAVGAVVGIAGAWALRRADARGWMTATYQRLAVLALAALAFLAAEAVTGNGFIAAFVGGLCFGTAARAQCPAVHEFAEREGELLAALTWTVFGAVIAGPRIGDIDARVVLYAVVSLVVVRVAAVALAMTFSRARPETVLFFGWFGPRGLASILFALLVVEESGMAGAEEVMVIVSATVLLSVFAHGLTAPPWSAWLARRLAAMPEDTPERHPVAEHVPPRGSGMVHARRHQ